MEKLHIKHCPECERGQIREVVGYESSGSTIDYVYETFKTPLVFVFEIYSDAQRSTLRFKSLEEAENKKNKENLEMETFLMSQG